MLPYRLGHLGGTLHLGLVHGELDGLGGRLGPQVVHPGLQAELPAVKVHRAHLAEVGLGDVHVEGLGLIDEGAPVRGHLQDGLLADFPDLLVNERMFFLRQKTGHKCFSTRTAENTDSTFKRQNNF